MKRVKNKTIGIIAEDDSDVESLKAIISLITKTSGIGIKKFVGKGCGKLKRKCNSWAQQLKQKECKVLIVVHDLDNHNIAELRKKLVEALEPCPFAEHLICIPVHELEAWFLSDPDAIKVALKIDKIPKVKGLPESIRSPKEYLEKLIRRISEGEKIYINTKHNEIIASYLSLDIVRKNCPSFIPFYEFIVRNYAA